MKPLNPKGRLFLAFLLLGAYILVGCAAGNRFRSNPCPSTGKQKFIGYGSYYRYSPLRDRWVVVTFNNCPPVSNLQWGGNEFTKAYYDSICKLPVIENQVDTLIITGGRNGGDGKPGKWKWIK